MGIAPPGTFPVAITFNYSPAKGLSTKGLD
jgi:hypothetical protein